MKICLHAGQLRMIGRADAEDQLREAFIFLKSKVLYSFCTVSEKDFTAKDNLTTNARFF